ncbi:hypothetical protein PV328_010883 [Microctonus aethiopoides]|uniref:Uncharacterized protein n=1 Tax=Microctonus aethiopoides TaxID=144406 RepID=A0AA39KQN5_9HYME|nr:hypothetical protein PV328_010883 [Microctonus aethiopoides]
MLEQLVQLEQLIQLILSSLDDMSYKQLMQGKWRFSHSEGSERWLVHWSGSQDSTNHVHIFLSLSACLSTV